MELQYLASNDIVKSSWYDKNEKNINLLEQQIYRLNSNIFVLDKILMFPFEYVFSDYPLFWGLIVDSLFETSILIIWKVAADGDVDGYTIQKLKKDISKNFCDANHKKRFEEICKKPDFDKIASNLRKSITLFRDKYADNFNLKLKATSSALDIKHKTELFLDLKEYKDDLNLLFRAISFDVKKNMLPEEYDIVSSDSKKKPDIVRLLDDLVKNSTWLNQHEKYFDTWLPMRKQKSEKELLIMNRYRAKFGLPTV